jgi:NTP pyrophosphatase (non-canonical NTP hydrolase)
MMTGDERAAFNAYTQDPKTIKSKEIEARLRARAEEYRNIAKGLRRQAAEADEVADRLSDEAYEERKRQTAIMRSYASAATSNRVDEQEGESGTMIETDPRPPDGSGSYYTGYVRGRRDVPGEPTHIGQGRAGGNALCGVGPLDPGVPGDQGSTICGTCRQRRRQGRGQP